MRNKDSGGKGMLTVVIVLAAVVLILGLAYLSQPTEVKQTTPEKASLADTDGGDQPAPTPSQAIPVAMFDADGYGKYRPAVVNPLNTTATEYKAVTIRVYKLNDNVEEFYDTVTTVTTGHITQANALKISGYGSSGAIQRYVAYVPASDESITSARYEFTAAGDVAPKYNVPEQAALIFKVYDETAKAYVYGNNETTAGGLKATGATFNGTSATGTEASVSTGGNYEYTIYLETNGSAASDKQFTDQSFLVAIDAQDLSDWQEPTLSMAGATVTKLSSGQYNDKIRNNGNDWVYKIEVNGKPLVVEDAFKKLTIQQYAKSGVAPTDNVAVSFITGGYYTETVGTNMRLGTHKDDASDTAVYTAQTITLQFA